MERIFAIAVCLASLIALPVFAKDNPKQARAVSSVAPDCLSKQNEWPGNYEIHLDISGLSARDVFDVVSKTTEDPIWQEGSVLTNATNLSRASDELVITVRPNMHRFPANTPLEKTRSKVEPKIQEIMRMKGVSVVCPQAGE